MFGLLSAQRVHPGDPANELLGFDLSNLPHLLVAPLLGEQRGLRAALDNSSLLEDEDLICLVQARQAVGDPQDAAAGKDGAEERSDS